MCLFLFNVRRPSTVNNMTRPSGTGIVETHSGRRRDAARLHDVHGLGRVALPNDLLVRRVRLEPPSCAARDADRDSRQSPPFGEAIDRSIVS